MLHTWIRPQQVITRLPSADTPPAMYLAHSMGVYHSKSIGGSNKTRLNDPEIDAFIDKVKATLDPEENVKIVTELSKSLNEICHAGSPLLKEQRTCIRKGPGRLHR